MIRLEDRQQMEQAIEQARDGGARLAPACDLVGIDPRTPQRWKAGSGLMKGDQRTQAMRPRPAHALSEAEREQIAQIANEPRFAEVPPARIVPLLADEGRYVASESSFHRVVRAEGQNRHRGRVKAPSRSRAPTTHVAEGLNAVWCRDMTYLPALVNGQWFYLYLIVDLYSRKIVGWEVHASDSADHAAQLVRCTASADSTLAAQDKPVLHGDNGSTLKATTVLAMLHWLGIEPSYSRPRVSNDNAYAESLFCTAKYRPEFPTLGFAKLEDPRLWARQFAHWYNCEHRHSGIAYVTPAQRPAKEDQGILSARHALYQRARETNPRRWTGRTRNWTPIGSVTLNSEKASAVEPQST